MKKHVRLETEREGRQFHFVTPYYFVSNLVLSRPYNPRGHLRRSRHRSRRFVCFFECHNSATGSSSPLPTSYPRWRLKSTCWMTPSFICYILTFHLQTALQGFSDPAPFATKLLRIRYSFRGHDHYAEIPDYLPVVLPLAGLLQSHF